MNKNYTLSLSEEDYLNYQLFNASQSIQTKSTRRRTVILVAAIFVFMAISSFYFNNDLISPIIYLFLAIATFFLYPLYQKWLYKRHYLKFIKENYQQNIGKQSQLIFSENAVEMKDADSQSEIQYSLIEAINEVPNTFYLKLKSSQSIIIPKNQVGNIEETRAFLKNLATEKNIIYNEFPNWKWK